MRVYQFHHLGNCYFQLKSIREKKSETLRFANSFTGAKDGTRTRDPDLGKVVLYQLSYFRIMYLIIGIYLPTSNFSIAVQR